MSSPVPVLVNGASGKMGKEACEAIEADEALDLVGRCDLGDNLSQMISSSGCRVVVDFTVASVAYENAKTIIEAGVHPVVGTTGFLPDQLKELQFISREKHLGGLIAPNFSISAVLMMKYASDAAKYFPDVEIIELHHDGKEESPSGTAIKTAELIRESVGADFPAKTSKEILEGACGASKHGVRIHSIRLPGLVAHQEVIFGGLGQTLSIRSDTIQRSSFMPGVTLACSKVIELDELVYGLEHLL